ncbi:MAG: helix-turn-helix domain-containing protein [Candidatus Bathyarchaeales archaeon]
MVTKTKLNRSDSKIDKIIRRLDLLAIILLAKSGLTRKEIADVLGISEKTIERMLPFSKISKRSREK